MINFVNLFLSYLMLLVIIAIIGAVAITLGITLRKKKNASEKTTGTEGSAEADEDVR